MHVIGFINPKSIFARFSLAFLLLGSGGCAREGGEATVAPPMKELSDLKGRTCATVLGTAIEGIVCSRQSGVVFKTFNDRPSALEALRLGKVDAIPIDTASARRWVSQRGEDFRIAFTFDGNPFGYFFAKGSPLRERVNGILAKMKASGELGRIVSKWRDAKDIGTVEMEPTDGWRKTAGTLRFATTGEFEPGSFIRGRDVVGFDIDIVRQIARALEMDLQLVTVNAPALVPAVQTGKAEMGGGCITITPPRKEKVDFSECYLDDGFAILVKAQPFGVDDGRASSVPLSLLRSLKGSFVRTFVTDGRWRLLASGLGVTLLITFLSAVFGTLLAFPVWKARTSPCAPVACLARWYISVLQGTPVLVLLMILFYLVFGNVDIDGVWVAVIGFSFNCSAYVGEMLRSGIEAVPRGQTEAALALGYGSREAFFRFVLPQAVRAILPVYRGELIGLLKSTSIVGYIAICDLTKSSDLVRSRTYESFFPILSTAFVYFVAAWLLAAALDRFGRRLDPASRCPCGQGTGSPFTPHLTINAKPGHFQTIFP